MDDREMSKSKESFECTTNPSAEEFRRCQTWLRHLPATDAQILQQTSEFREFIHAFYRLEQARRRIVSTTAVKGNPHPLVVGDASSDTSLFPGSRYQETLLQSLLAEDIVLRILDFLDSQSLVRLSKTCSRLHQLCVTNAHHRSADILHARQLPSPMQLLRAKEQIQGMGLSPMDKHVPVPSLLLTRRILVTDCSDVECNGVYYCTGCNGNGFIFTKPREQHMNNGHILSRLLMSDDLSDISSSFSRAEFEPDIVAGAPLRCILAKRFSNETILWYMSKEVVATEDSEDGEVQAGDVTQVFCFWAKLMVIGDASPDICRYPSQSSILQRHGEGWQTLSTTRTVEPPVVELLD